MNNTFALWLKATCIYFVGKKGELTRNAPTSPTQFIPIPVLVSITLYPLCLALVIVGLWLDRHSLLNIQRVGDVVVPLCLVLFVTAVAGMLWNSITAAHRLWVYAKCGKLKNFPRQLINQK